MEKVQIRNVFFEAFLQCFMLKSPITKMSLLPHWSICAVKHELSSRIENIKTYLLGGCFYNFSTPVPSLAVLQEALEFIKQQKVEQILIPNVRYSENTSLLRRYGFVDLESEPECVFTIPKRACGLKSRIGSKTHRELKRLMDKADSHFSFKIIGFDELKKSSYLESMAELHQEHSMKYHHGVNIFNFAFLHKLANSKLNPFLKFYVRCDQKGRLVQGGIFFEVQSERTLYYCTQAIKRSAIEKGHNLYLASFMKIFNYAFHQGYELVNLGRGKAQEKVRLGADGLIPQKHWLYSAYL